MRRARAPESVTRADFTSALYLGFTHPAGSLGDWTSLTSGRPAALESPGGAARVSREIAALAGAGGAITGPSTLHLFLDLFRALCAPGSMVCIDEGAYPIARMAVREAQARGALVRGFRHFDPSSLEALLTSKAARGRRPVVLTDGFCPWCGRPAPLADYLGLARASGGTLVMDDTQALGIMGGRGNDDAPYGRGGGGSLRWHGIGGPAVIAVSSLSKAFGAPMAVLAGCRSFVKDFERGSFTRMHCSPPSAVVIRAAQNALALNRSRGDRLRQRLASLVRLFKLTLASGGILTGHGLFPVQAVLLNRHTDPVDVHSRLQRAGISALLQRGRASGRPRLGFVITAAHSSDEVLLAAKAVIRAARLKAA